MRAERLSDDQLCWHAVRDQARRRTARVGWSTAAAIELPAILLGLLLGGLWGGVILATFAAPIAVTALRIIRDVRAKRMKSYLFATTDTARELAPEERARLRETGRLPPWFVERVVDRVRLGR